MSDHGQCFYRFDLKSPVTTKLQDVFRLQRLLANPIDLFISKFVSVADKGGQYSQPTRIFFFSFEYLERKKAHVAVVVTDELAV
ncbi:hypothetical protein BpHYR1_042980 [Brachionus plicatilis]|uniref:Uncharacterized protein n=1 Tax=Brachionus plicatilis TaxID=10195 RepID=A0A3M7PD82_BRAPC|nr:hypothetical protein BpHYR1_042980 [Brachionus plicatilis]